MSNDRFLSRLSFLPRPVVGSWEGWKCLLTPVGFWLGLTQQPAINAPPEPAASSSKLGWGCLCCDGQSLRKLHHKSCMASSGGYGVFTPSLCQISAAADQPTKELPSILTNTEKGKMYFKKMQVCKGTTHSVHHGQE